MKTIMVSGASGIVGYGILRSLRKINQGYQLIGTTIYGDSVAEAFCDVLERAPRTDSAEYMDWLAFVVEKHYVDLLIPGIEVDMFKWSEERERIQNFGQGTKLLLNNSELISLCKDKWLFYNKLKDFFPDLVIESKLTGSYNELVERYGIPFLLKPRCGFASKGIVVIDNKSQFEQSKVLLGNVLMAQPIVGDNDHEYTVSTFFDSENKLCCYIALKRKLAKEGFTEKAQVVEFEGIENIFSAVGSLVKAVGPTNFQFRIHNGQLKLLEINPRISSSTAIRAAFGYNESLMGVEYYLDGKIPMQPEIKYGYAVRYTEECIFYDRNYI